MHHMTLMQEGPINTLALNKDCNKVVVTGRNGLAQFYNVVKKLNNF